MPKEIDTRTEDGRPDSRPKGNDPKTGDASAISKQNNRSSGSDSKQDGEHAVTTPTHDDDASPVTRTQLAFIFIGLLMAMFVSSLSETIASTALPTIVGDLGGVEMMQWISTAYILTSTIVMPAYGKISDVFGRKRLIIGALALYAAGKAVCGIAVNMEMLICGRLISGLGGGGLSVLSLATLSDVVPPRKLGVYMGVMGSIFTISNVLGPVLGGWFVQVTGWRWIFWFTIPLAMLAIAALAFFLPKDSGSKHKPNLDYFGFACMALSVTSLVLFLAWGGTMFAWDSFEIIGLIILFAAAVIGLIISEKHAKEPIMPLSLFRNRNFVLCACSNLLVDIAFIGAITYLPTYFQIVDKLTPELAGLMCVPMSIGIFITSTASGFIVSRTGKYKWMLILSTVMTTVGFFLMSTLKVDGSLIFPLVYQFILGFGLGFGMQILTLVVQNEFSHAIVGTATASYNFFGQIGSVLGASFIGTLFTSRLTADLAKTLPKVDNISVGKITPQLVDKLPDNVQTIIAQGYSDALIPLFLGFVPLCAITIILMIAIKFHPLAKTIDHKGH